MIRIEPRIEHHHVVSMTIDWQARPYAEDVASCLKCGWSHREPRLIYSDAGARMTRAIQQHWFEFGHPPGAPKEGAV